MTKEKTPKYSGILIEPIELNFGLLVSSEELSSQYAWEHTKRMEALYKHYDIDIESPLAHLNLAVKLAEAHVPGFAVKSPDEAWRQAKTFDNLMQIYIDVTDLQLRKNLSIRSACRHLSNNKYSPKTLVHIRRRYYEFLKN